MARSTLFTVGLFGCGSDAAGTRDATRVDASIADAPAVVPGHGDAFAPVLDGLAQDQAAILLDATPAGDAEVPDAAPGADDVALPPPDGSGALPPDDGGAPDAGTGRAPFDWVGIVGTGQSLSVGAGSNGAISTIPSYHNLKLSLGGLTTWPIDPNNPLLAMVPLLEPIRPTATRSSAPYPTNLYGETPHTAMASQITSLFQAMFRKDYVTTHSVVGQGAQSITVIGKNGSGNAYAASMFELTAIRRLAGTAGKTFGVGAVVLTHGEADALRPSYEADIAKLQSDYATDIKALTGQTADVPLIASQQNTVPASGLAVSPVAVWRAGVDHPGRVVCSGPKYQYEYAADHLHLRAESYVRLGEKYAQVYYERVVLGHDWQPLQPIAVTRVQSTITLQFHVPVPPLTWNVAAGAPHQTVNPEWASGRGFEVSDSLGAVPITSVAIDMNSVHIVLGRVPVATASAPVWVRYAMTQDGTGNQGGLVTGRFGQLRDSDPFVGVDAADVACSVANGSATLTATTAPAFPKRAPRDVAVAAGLPPDTTVQSISGSTMVLDKPWSGATGPATVHFHSDQRNYAVAFELTAP